jgi:Thiolase C-terminal domain-like
VTVAHYLGLTPKWVHGTAVGGCSFMIHVRHAAAAIAAGLCETVLITHGGSGCSGVGRTRNVVAPTSLAGQFEQPNGAAGAADFVHDPGIALREDLWLDTRAIGCSVLARVSRPRWSPHPSFPRKRGSRAPQGFQPSTLDPRFRGGDDNPLPRGEAGAFIAGRNTAPGGRLPLNTNGGP